MSLRELFRTLRDRLTGAAAHPGSSAASTTDDPIVDNTYIEGTPPYGREIDSPGNPSCKHDWTLVTAHPQHIAVGTTEGAPRSEVNATYRREFVCDLCGATMHDFKDVS